MSMVISGDNGLTFPAGSTQVQAGNYQTMVNRIINPRMEIDQRNAGASVTVTNTAANTYLLDRWLAYTAVTSKFSVQQSSVAPTGFTNSLLVTSLAATTVGSSDRYYIGQFIEGFNTADLGFGTASASTVTLSFWVRSSLTGTFGGTLMNDASNRNYPFTYTISAANTWEQKSITVAGDTTGTWVGGTNGIGLKVFFGLGVGSSASGGAGSWQAGNFNSATGATSVVGTNGATFYITGVDLRVGSYTVVPQDFRSYETELALCQRYYEKSYNIDIAPGTASTAYSAFSSSGSAGGLTTAYLDSWLPFKVPKRGSVTMSAWDEANNSGKCTRVNPGVLATSNENLGFNSTVGLNSVTVSSVSGANAGRFSFNWTASAEL